MSKEATVGLSVALELFLQRDHDAEFQEHLRQVEVIHGVLSGRDDVDIEIIADQRIGPDPLVRLAPTADASWMPDEIRAKLLNGEPRIYT